MSFGIGVVLDLASVAIFLISGGLMFYAMFISSKRWKRVLAAVKSSKTSVNGFQDQATWGDKYDWALSLGACATTVLDRARIAGRR
jgi:hypothetical protein